MWLFPFAGSFPMTKRSGWGTRVPAGCPTCALAQNTVKGADASTS
jgi:hypothetical protein